MKKIILPLMLLYFIPFAGTSQFTEKHKPDNNNNSNNSSNPGDTNKNKGGTKTGEAFTAVFDDGSKMDYIVTSKAAGDENKVTIDLPPFGMYRGWNYGFLEASYYSPERFFLKTYFTLSVGNNGSNALGASGDILYFLTTAQKLKSTSLRLSESTTLIKYVKHEITKEVSFGIHGGIGYEGIERKLADGNTTGDSIHTMAPVVAIGIGLFKARHAEWFVPSDNSRKIRKHTINTGIYLDMLYIPYSTALNHIGARAYIDGKISFYKTHEWGWYYQAGFIVDGMGQPIMLGLGPYITF